MGVFRFNGLDRFRRHPGSAPRDRTVPSKGLPQTHRGLTSQFKPIEGSVPAGGAAH